MESVRTIMTSVAALVAITGVAAAQTNVTATNKFSWAENVGWMNWRDAGAPVGAQGALLQGSFASGFVWMENVGWLNLGDGTPANGVSYANVNGTDFGVNIAGDGSLSGFAWGENIGWVNFTLPSLPVADRPRLDLGASRLRGFAWGENIGWINLSSSEEGKYVGVRCSADFNNDGQVDFFDYLDFAQAFAVEDPSADFNSDGQVDFFDFLDFAAAFDTCSA
ncbi:MAG: hypothetical protein SFZ23_04765 [Planctomycetota bacterium]|nr:hypothetical protein [Planctomycetota bacterium]